MHSSSRPGVVTAAFRGSRTATGSLTHGQRNVLMWIDAENNKWSSVIPLFQPIPDGVPAQAIVDAVAVLIGRHESLRTGYLTGDGDPVQRVSIDGEVTAEVCELTGDDTVFLSALEARLCEKPFDRASELPVRAAIVTAAGRPVLVVLVISHMAVDVGSIAVLRRELTALLDGTDPADLGKPGVQPIEVAVAEQRPIALRRAAAAVRHWDGALRGGPLRLAVPSQPGAGGPIPRRVRLTSPAAALALSALGTGAGPSATVLAAVAAVLGLRTGTGACLFASVSGNRFHPGLGAFVGSLAQDALVSFSLDAPTFGDLVERAWSAQLTAYRNSRFDPAAVWVAIEDVQHRTGSYFGRDWVFNDVGAHLETGPPPPRTAATDIAGALSRSRLDWTDVDHVPVMLFFRLAGVRGELDLELHFDARYFPPADVEMLLLGVERLLVAAAAGEVRLGDLAAVTRCEPLARGGGWVRSGASWVDLAAVRDLVASVLTGEPSGVELAGDGAITAYVCAGQDLDLGALHTACVAALPDRPAAVAPARYVVCASAPAAGAAWAGQPVLAQGDGR